MKADNPFSALGDKRIVILIGYFGRGGCERQAFLLCRGLRQRYGLDAQVWALAGAHDPEYRREFEAAGIPTRLLGFRRPPLSPFAPAWAPGWMQMLWRIAGELKQGQIDVLLPLTTWPNVVAGLTYRLAGIPLCIWGERHCGGERIPVLERFAVKQYRRFVANSSAGVEFLSREMGISREQISCVPNGVEEFKIDTNQNWRSRLRLKPDELLVVKIANVTGFKDHLTLLRAWRIVQENWDGEARPYLALAGACYFDDVYDECLRTIREAGLDSTVQFLESIPDVPALIGACDIGTFSSRNEGMPNGLLECMAAGKAVVASDLPGIRDALGPNAAGVVVPPGDASAFARVLLDLLLDSSKRDRLGKANRARVQTELSVDHMVDRHLGVIEQETRRNLVNPVRQEILSTDAPRQVG
jgi:glycosyltransferase involved in cell wall biosynthesis